MDTDSVSEEQAGLVDLERGRHLALPIAGGRHGQLEVGEPLGPLVVHALEDVGQPPNSGFADDHAQVLVLVEHTTEDELGDALDHAQLEDGEPSADPCGPLAVGGGMARIDRRTDRVQVNDRPALVGGLPDRRELLTPQREKVVGHRHLDRSQSSCGASADLVGCCRRVLARQARDAHEARGVVRAELREPRVVALHDCGGHVLIVDRVGHAENAVEHLADDAVTVLCGDAQCRIGRVEVALRAVVPEATLVHSIEAGRLAASVWLAGVAAATDERKLTAVLVDPELPAVSFDHSRHACAKARRGEPVEQVVRE